MSPSPKHSSGRSSTAKPHGWLAALDRLAFSVIPFVGLEVRSKRLLSGSKLVSGSKTRTVASMSSKKASEAFSPLLGLRSLASVLRMGWARVGNAWTLGRVSKLGLRRCFMGVEEPPDEVLDPSRKGCGVGELARLWLRERRPLRDELRDWDCREVHRL